MHQDYHTVLQVIALTSTVLKQNRQRATRPNKRPETTKQPHGHMVRERPTRGHTGTAKEVIRPVGETPRLVRCVSAYDFGGGLLIDWGLPPTLLSLISQTYLMSDSLDLGRP